MNKQATSARRAQKETAACGAALVRKGAADHRAVSAEAAAEDEDKDEEIRRLRALLEEKGAAVPSETREESGSSLPTPEEPDREADAGAPPEDASESAGASENEPARGAGK